MFVRDSVYPVLTVKRLSEVDDLAPPLFLVPPFEVLLDLPVKCRFHGILNAKRAAFNKENMRQVGRHCDSLESVEEVGLFSSIDIRVRRLVDRNIRQLLKELRSPHPWVVQSNRRRGDKREKVQISFSVLGIDDIRAAAVLQIDDDLVPIHQHVLAQRWDRLCRCDLVRGNRIVRARCALSSHGNSP